MSQLIQSFNLGNLTAETDPSTDDLVLTTTQDYVLNPVSGTTVCEGLSIHNNNHSIYDLTSNNGLVGSNNTIEARGTGNLIFLSNTSNTTLTLNSSGVVSFNNLPTSTGSATNSINEFIKYDKFLSSSYISFTPVITSSGTPGTITYTSQSGKYQRIGDIVNFQAEITVNTISGYGVGDSIRISIPVMCPYLTIGQPVPQVLMLGELLNTTGTNFDTFVTLQAGGTGTTGTNVDYAGIFMKTGATSNSTTMKFANITNGFKISYSGSYFVFP
jgi:hypothetical protein